MALDYDRTGPVYDNTAVDNFTDREGQIDQYAALSFDMPDREIVRNLNQRINDSESYWNDAKGYDLKNARNVNQRMHLGRVDESGLYKHQKQYKENQIFVGEESIVAYVTSQIAGPLVVPAGKEDLHKTFAGNLEKAIKCYCTDVIDLEALVEMWARDILNNRVAVAHFYFDADLNEVILSHESPEHVILDKDCALGKNPGFICHVLKRSADQLISEHPEAEKKILEYLGIQRKTIKQMTKVYAVRKVFVTWYDKKGKAEEGVVWYLGDTVFKKIRNPNYLYAKKDMNLLKYPKKPYIFGNLVNYGAHLIDNTTPLEQAIEPQLYLMRRGRQIAENADKANGKLVISTRSGLTKDDGQNITGDPNQKLFIDDEDGQGVDKLVMQLEAQTLPDYVVQDKQDARMQIGNIMGAPTDFTGSEANDGDPTLGQVMIKKNQAAGRQDMMVRAITRMLRDVYEYLVQMFIVWYTEERQFTYDGGDGEYDYITLKRELIHKGIRVKASKPANPDRSRIEAIVLKLLEQKAISLLDAYKILQLENAQQLYDNWAKQQRDPMSLARDALDVIDATEANVAFQDIMNGEKVPPKDMPTKEYILALRKLMIDGVYTNSKGDDVAFVKAPSKDQARFIKYVNQCIDGLEQRIALEEASEVGPPTGESLRPGAQLPNPNMPAPPPFGAPPAGPPQGGMPGQPPMPPMGGAPMPPGMPPGPMAPPPGMQPRPLTPGGVFGGTPIPAPGSAPVPQPTNPASLPMV